MGWTQVDLAVNSKVSENQISVIENGHEGPNFQTLLAISLALGKYPSQVLDFEYALKPNSNFPKHARKPGTTTILHTLIESGFLSKWRFVSEVVAKVKEISDNKPRSSEVSAILTSLVKKKILTVTKREGKNSYKRS